MCGVTIALCTVDLFLYTYCIVIWNSFSSWTELLCVSPYLHIALCVKWLCNYKHARHLSSLDCLVTGFHRTWITAHHLKGQLHVSPDILEREKTIVNFGVCDQDSGWVSNCGLVLFIIVDYTHKKVQQKLAQRACSPKKATRWQRVSSSFSLTHQRRSSSVVVQPVAVT